MEKRTVIEIVAGVLACAAAVGAYFLGRKARKK